MSDRLEKFGAPGNAVFSKLKHEMQGLHLSAGEVTQKKRKL